MWSILENTAIETRKRLQIRCSSLPMCPRAYYLDYVFGPLPQTFDYKKEVITQKGNFVHEAMQRWLGKANILYGMWSCPIKEVNENLCNYTRGPTLFNNLKRKVCPKHRLQLKYEEVSLNHKELTGHCDGLITFDNKKTFYLLEIKTISTMLADGKGWAVLEQPIDYHVEQSNMYAYILEKEGFSTKKGKKIIKIEKVLMWYVHTDYPWKNPKVWAYTPDHTRAIEHFRTISIINRSKRENKLPKKSCKDKINQWCPYAPICSLPNLKEQLNARRNKN